MRINGLRVTNLQRWTPEELIQGIEQAEIRLEAVWADLAKFNGELALRETVHHPEPNLDYVAREPERYNYE